MKEATQKKSREIWKKKSRSRNQEINNHISYSPNFVDNPKVKN